MSQANKVVSTSSSDARSPTLAIIGMEGSGKTVLATTLAKKLSKMTSHGVFLNPQDTKTLKYVEQVWQTLLSGDWPPSTPPGTMFELHWKLQGTKELECNVRLIDPAGQDLRMLFGDDQIQSVDSLPKHLQALAAYCRSADIIMFLINLRDFVGQGDPALRIANEAAIKAAMDYLGENVRPRRFCLVLTQADLYRNLAEQHGGWHELAKNAIPYVFASHVQHHKVAVCPVSAVADTQVVTDQDGSPRRVPAQGFRCEGLDDLFKWFTTQVKEVRQKMDVEAKPATVASAGNESISPANPNQPGFFARAIPWVLVVLFWCGIGGLMKDSGCQNQQKPTPPKVTPKPPAPKPVVTFDFGIDWGVINDDIWIKNTSKVTLTNVRLTVHLKKRDQPAYLPLELHVAGVYPGERKTWANVMSILSGSIDNTTHAILNCDQTR